ncbi:alpha/beta fold hydrolase [Actinomadura viridis]|uniref:alpha/beta fold hydrolase n=1 Tax=Actinomadura viridis TaxID=58110 RepID=UPI0036B6CF7C
MGEEVLLSVNGVELCAQTFGERGDAPVLLVGNSMLTWPEELCELLAGGGRFVLRYDLRDTGRSTMADPAAPRYTLRDLVADAAGLLDAFGLPRAHVAGFGVGGWIAQLLALDHPGRVASLTLAATRPVAPGPNDPDLPEHSPKLMAAMMAAPEPDWTDRASVIEAMVAGRRHVAGTAGFDEDWARRHVERIFDRTVVPAGTDPAMAHRSNQTAIVFAALDCGDRWRERLGSVTAPTLVIHGEDDPFFPIGNGRALAKEIPGAELIGLPGAGQELPPRVWEVMAFAILRHTRSGV